MCFGVFRKLHTILLQRFALGDVDAGAQGLPEQPQSTGFGEQRAWELAQ